MHLTNFSYLGANPSWGFVTGNNALPRTHGLRQPVHKDITFFHPQVLLVLLYTITYWSLQCPFFVIANVPLCPFNPTTGSTEFWLGSHAHTAGTDQVLATPDSQLANAKLVVGEPNTFVLPEVVEERRKIRPPIQPTCDKGDIILRDLRTWHAGMPNESDEYRIMLALGYQVGGGKASLRLFWRSGNRHNGIRIIPYARNFLWVKQISSWGMEGSLSRWGQISY